MKKQLSYCIVLAFLFCQLNALAQTNPIKGRVTDESGAPVAGANVLIKGSKNGVQTDINGNFTINSSAPGKVSLVISHTGFKPFTVSAEAATAVAVKMEKEVASLDDVVVIGYQSVQRKNLLASVSSVGAKDLKDIPINSAAEALNGRLAGVTATTAEGSPDAQVRVRVRGGMSITGDNSPLYIVDGVQMENALNFLSPQDIQSIDVLKDAAATAIYGARGANGVLVITTKKGRQGRLLVSFNAFVGVKWLPKTLPVMDPYNYVIYQSERSRGSSTDSTTFLKNFGSTWDTLANYKNQPPVNWQDETFGNTGVSQMYNLSAAGGSQKLTYNFGYTFNDDKAIVVNSKYQRHLLNGGLEYKISDRIKIGAIARYMHQNVWGAGVSDDKGTSYNRLRNAVKYRPYLSPNQELEDPDPLADPNVGNGLILVNPLLLADAEYRQKTTDNFNLNANITIGITKNLSFRSIFGYINNSLVDRQFSDSITPYSTTQGAKKPIVQLDTTNSTTITNSNVFTYSLKGIGGKHDVDVLLGEETYDLRTKVYNNLFKGFPNGTSHDDAFNNTSLGTPFTGYPKYGETRYTSLSFFGRVNYSYLSKYFFSFNMRADGASKFAPGRQWGYFPAASVAWRVKNEKFMETVSWISDLKLRAGFGTVGNNRIDDYLFMTTFKNDGTYFYGLNNQAILAYYSSGLVNENLKWESTLNRNYGIDISFFNRLNLSVDIYNNTSKDLLLNVPIAPTYGYSLQWQNVGQTSNKGVELQLGGNIMRKKDNFTWNASFNMSFNRNQILALGLNQKYFYPPASWGVSGQPTDYIEQIGQPVGSMYGLVNDGFYKVEDFNYNNGVYTLKSGIANDSSIIGTPQVQPGAIKFKDLNGDGTVDLNNDRKIIGNPTPKFTGGLNQQFTYKQWDMSIFVNFSYGNDIYNANKIELTNGYTPNSNMLALMNDRWRIVTADGRTAQWTSGNLAMGLPPDQLAALNANAKIWQPIKGAGAFYPSSWAIEDGSFLRINNITLGYSLPQQVIGKLKMSRLRFYFTANNIAVLTSYTGYDPEVSVRSSPLTPALDYSAYPKSRSFIFGLNASF